MPHDTWADYYDSIFDDLDRDYTEKTLTVIKSILPEGGDIIDFGAGTGRISIALRKMGFSIRAIEQSSEMCRVMEQKAKAQNYHFKIEQCSIAEYEGVPANLAISLCGVLNYVLTEDALENSFRSYARNISPNGYLLIDYLVEESFEEAGIDQTDDLIRKVVITKEANDLYLYSEVCSGSLDGRPFKYKDKFKLKKWSRNAINLNLAKFGFAHVKDIVELSPDYSCHLYRKIS